MGLQCSTDHCMMQSISGLIGHNYTVHTCMSRIDAPVLQENKIRKQMEVKDIDTLKNDVAPTSRSSPCLHFRLNTTVELKQAQ